MQDPIRVITIFSDGIIKPLYFIWNNRRLRVERVTYNWRTIDERGVSQHFSVISGSFYYHMLYVPSLSRWYLMEVESILS